MLLLLNFPICCSSKAITLFYFLQTLEKDTIKFVKNELKKIQGILDRGRLQNQEEEMLYEQEKKRSKQAILNISLHFLRTMNHGELVDELLNGKIISRTNVALDLFI